MPRSGTRKPKPAQTRPPVVGIVVSRYNASITERLLDGALAGYRERGGEPADVVVVEAPGAYELPFLSLALAGSGRVAGVVALGCLIKGETRHDRYIAEAVSHGLMNASLLSGVPVCFGVLTVDTPSQAHARAGGKHGNKGAETMTALLDTLDAAGVLGSPRPGAAKPRMGRKPDKARGRGA